MAVGVRKSIGTRRRRTAARRAVTAMTLIFPSDTQQEHLDGGTIGSDQRDLTSFTRTFTTDAPGSASQSIKSGPSLQLSGVVPAPAGSPVASPSGPRTGGTKGLGHGVADREMHLAPAARRVQFDRCRNMHNAKAYRGAVR